MKRNLIMEFSVDKEKKAITVKREFEAPLAKVWAAWTQSNILDQWWAPKPWKGRTKSMDFSEGGMWLYAMVGPDRSEHWSRVDYITINPMKAFSSRDAFCDENGNIDPNMPTINWSNSFREDSGSTIVNVVLTFDRLTDLEKIIEMGFREGFTAGLENLDELLGR